MILRKILKARYVFALMAMLGQAVAFMMRACLSLVITKLVPSTLDEPQPSQDKTYSWNEETQGIILAAFYCGYFFTHIPGGMLSEKFGGKYTFGVGILLTAIFTLITPWVVDDNPTGFILLRFLEGVGEGTVVPALYTMLARWAPPSEKSFITSFTLLGGLIGTIFANVTTGFILQYIPNNSWKIVFYFFGTISIAWCFLWWILCYNDPQSHPFISKEEKQYLERELGSTERDKNLQSAPWKRILTSSPIWALIAAEIGQDWGIYTIVTDFPKYLNDVLKFSPVQNGLLSSFSYVAFILASWISSGICDWILQKKKNSNSLVRKLYATISSTGFAIFLLVASYVQNISVICTCVIVGMSFFAFGLSSVKVTALDLSPNYSGSVIALVNGMGCISGMLSPYIVGLLTPNRSADEWRLVFWTMAGVLLITNSIYVMFGSCKLQEWNNLEEKSKDISIEEIKPL